MSNPKYEGRGEGFGVDDQLTAETFVHELFPEVFTGDIMKELTREERELRADAYDAAHAALTGLKSAVGQGNSYHKTFVDVGGLPFERRVAVQSFTDRVGGPMSRLIVNDEGLDPDSADLHVVYMRDYFLSDRGKAFTWQETKQTRPRHIESWAIFEPSAGPLVQQKHDSVVLYSGEQYIPQIAGMSNGAVALMESLERRTRLEEFTVLVASLGIETYEPGITVGAKLV